MEYNFAEIIPVFSTFSNFFKKKEKKIIKAILCNFSMGLLKYLKKKKNFAPQNIKKLPSKVAQNPTRPKVFNPASIWLCGTETVLLSEIVSSLKLSNIAG